MVKLAVIIIFSSLIVIEVHAQKLKVLDAYDSTALVLVSVSVNGYLQSNTDSNGEVEISDYRGEEAIVFRRMGYAEQTKSFDEIERAGFVVSLKPIPFRMDELLITATRWDESSSEVPSKVKLISQKEIALQNVQTTADLLGVSGDVFIQKSQQGGGSPMIRGFSANRLLYVVDGVRMNNAIFRSGNLHNVISIDPFSIQTTEVFFGPSSVMYGSDAIGGVMSFQSIEMQPNKVDGGNFAVNLITKAASANKEKTLHGDFKIIGKRIASYTSFTFTAFDNLKMGLNGPDDYLRHYYVIQKEQKDIVVQNDDLRTQIPTGYFQNNFMQKFQFSPNQFWEFNYVLHYSQSSNIDRYDRHLRTVDDKPLYGEWYYGPQLWMMNNLKVQYKKSNTFFDRMKIILAYQLFEESRISRSFNHPIRRKRFEKVNAYSVNFDLSKKINSKHHIYYGLEGVLNLVDSKGINQNINQNIEEKGPSRYPQASWSSLALYLRDKIAFSSKLQLELSARYNYVAMEATFDTTFYPLPVEYTQIQNNAINMGLGIIANPGKGFRLNVNFSTGFRAPNVDDMGKVFDSEPGAVVVPNPNLKAEYAYNIEVGVSKVFSQFVKLDLSTYYTYLDNAMVRRDYILNGKDSLLYDGEMSKVQAIQNAGFSNVYGVQAGVEFRLTPKLKLLSQYNLQEGKEEIEDGILEPSRHAAPWFGVSRLNYHRAKWELELSMLYSGSKSFEDLPGSEKKKDFLYAKDMNGNPYSPSWCIFNLNGMYLLNNYMALKLGVENITNIRYRPYSSGLAGAGLNVKVALRIHF